MRSDWFPDAYRDGQEARIEKTWDLSWPLPVPVFMPKCPACALGRMVLKDWKFHSRANTGTSKPWRCDVRLKCIDCSHVPIYGIPVPEDMWCKGSAVFGHGWINWRTGKDILTRAGFFDE